MALSQKLEIRQSHALVMTPQLMQAIKLLQLSNLDLAGYVETELERNPLLERGAMPDPSPSRRQPSAMPARRPAIRAPRGTEPDLNRRAPAPPTPATPAPIPTAATTPIRWLRARRRTCPQAIRNGTQRAADAAPTATTIRKPSSRPSGRSGSSRRAACARGHRSGAPDDRQYLIDLCDEAGYLNGDLAQVADKLGATIGDVEAVLALLQSFDPPGVCARNLTECLAIQLRSATASIRPCRRWSGISTSWPSATSPRFKKMCGVGEEDLLDMIAEIRALNPKPGLAFGTTLVQPIVPDVFVRPAADGSFAVELNSETLPKVLVNQMLLYAGRQDGRTTRTRPIWPTACRPRPG